MRRSLPVFAFFLLLWVAPASAQVEGDFSLGGGIRIGDSTTACSAAIEGAIRYDSDSGKVLGYCNGTAWTNLTTGGGMPAGANTQVQFNSSGVFGADVGLAYDASADALSVAGSIDLGLITGAAPASGFSPAGSDMQIQFNSGGSFGGSAGLIWNNDSSELGIGTTTPAHKVHLYGTGYPTLAIEADEAEASEIALFTKGDGQSWLGQGTQTQGWNISARGETYGTVAERNDLMLLYFNGSSWPTYFMFENSGRFGIMTANPQGALDVNGTVFLNVAAATTDRESLCIAVGGGGVTRDAAGNNCDTSSARFKHDIAPLDIDGLNLISAFKPSSFIYNSDKDNIVKWGFIAEEMAAIDPHFAAYDEAGLPYSINKYAIMAVMAEAIKELKVENDTLKARLHVTNQTLKATDDNLLARIEALERNQNQQMWEQ